MLALVGDFLGSYALLRLTRRWWLIAPGAIGIGILSGTCGTLLMGAISGEEPGRILASAIQSAALHALITVPAIFLMRRWLSPRTG